MHIKLNSKATRIWVAVLVLWVVFVWTRSMVPGTESSDHSMFVVHLVRPLLEFFGVHDVGTMNFIVRKCAHFTEYAVMGAVAMRVFMPRVQTGRKWLLLQLAILVCVPAIDETIQLFVPGRCGAVTDVMIDVSGAVTGACLCALGMWLWTRHREKRARA
jgi:VanZ family protein